MLRVLRPRAVVLATAALAASVAVHAAEPVDTIQALLRYSRAAMNEVGAMGGVRSVESAQAVYRSAKGSYGELACLVEPARCGLENTPAFLDAGMAAPSRNGYRRRLVVGGAGATFAYLAVPEQPGVTGFHGFCADDTGRICYTRDGSEPPLSGGRCAPSCPTNDPAALTARKPQLPRADLQAALEALEKPPLVSQPEAVREGWRAMLQAALAATPEAGAAAASRGRAHEGGVAALAFTPDGRTLVTSTMEDSKAPIKVWSVADGRLMGALAGDCPSVWALRVSGDGASVLATCMNKTLRQWSLADRKEKPTLAELTTGMADLGAAADGRLVAAGGGFLGSAGTVAFVALPSGRRVGTIALPEGASRIALSPDGRTLVSAGFDAQLQLWSVPDGRLAATLGKSADATALAISHDSRVLALASAGEISLWSLADRKKVGSITGHAFAVNGLAFGPDGRLLSASSDHSVKLWSVPDGRLVATLRGHTTEVYGVAVSSDGRLAASSDRDGGVVLWDLQKGERLRELVDPATPARVSR